MIQKEIRVGIVGADTKASWAKVSHVPAIQGLPGLKLAAVATRNEQSAREAAEAFSPPLERAGTGARSPLVHAR
jgi:predicted dehydrogenase